MNFVAEKIVICWKFEVLAGRTVNVKITEELKTTPICRKK